MEKKVKKMQQIQTKTEYDYLISRKFQPLILNQYFNIEHGLRVEIQMALFGRSFLNKGNVLQGNQRFYEWCWKNILGIEGDHICENCTCELYDYSATHVSHIISRSNRSDLAHDPRNVNILCKKCHDQWENIYTRKNMNIFILNSRIINMLIAEYVKQ